MCTTGMLPCTCTASPPLSSTQGLNLAGLGVSVCWPLAILCRANPAGSPAGVYPPAAPALPLPSCLPAAAAEDDVSQEEGAKSRQSPQDSGGHPLCFVAPHPSGHPAG